MAAAIVTLTSDFGQTDGFVGAMKGVILGINPDAKLTRLARSYHWSILDIGEITRRSRANLGKA